MEKKLQVRDLSVSFRTSNGMVHAVRDINFDLYKGETLAIVGESGSGKSVTSKTILGILAGNSLIESGEIIYDGKDLIRISEDEFHKIRGDKIAMIFQDPMSSLNPIVKIGRQLTEAMLLKGKARQKESRNTFNTYLKNLNTAMIEAEGDASKAGELTQKCKDFDKMEVMHVQLENAYNTAREAAEENANDLKDLIFELEKHGAKDVPYRMQEIAEQAKESANPYVVKEEADRLKQLSESLKGMASSFKKEDTDPTEALKIMKEMQEITLRAIEKKKPDFFAMGYYMAFSGQHVPEGSIEEIDRQMQEYTNEKFLNSFVEEVKKAYIYNAEKSYKKKDEAIAVLEQNLPVFQKEKLDRKEMEEACKTMSAAVEATVNPLLIVKDSFSYTFPGGLKSEIERYYSSITKNAKEEKKHDKAQAKYDKKKAKGKEPDWKVPAAQITSLPLVQQNMISLITRLIDTYKEAQAMKASRDFDAEVAGVMDYLNEQAAAIALKVTKKSAKAKAIKLMEEVGIAEPRKRYNQYPFEFSGGMRQRIVIAIALAADPDILICDEPTTALDVTIQSQILELINNLKRERNLSVIFITHDLGVVANMADRIAVMYAGKIIEYGTSEEIFYSSAHPYTWALLSSMPDLDTNERLEAIPGTPPNMIYPPKGDAFAARNKYAMKIDFERQPPMFKITDTHYAATWLLHPDAPKVEMPKVITERIARMRNKAGGETDGQ